MLQTLTTRLIQKIQLTSDVYLFKFTLLTPKEINFLPGQYVILNIPQNNGVVLHRLYSIASPPSQKGSFELVVKLIPEGVASLYFLNLKEGDNSFFQGPAGAFQLRQTNKDKVFLVTGTGIAPVMSMILNLLNSKSETGIFLFWGLPTFKDTFFIEELKNLKNKYKNFHFNICLSQENNLEMVMTKDRGYFHLGHIDHGCEEVMEKTMDFEYYLCGRREVVESLKQYLFNSGVDKENVILEKF